MLLASESEAELAREAAAVLGPGPAAAGLADSLWRRMRRLARLPPPPRSRTRSRARCRARRLALARCRLLWPRAPAVAHLAADAARLRSERCAPPAETLEAYVARRFRELGLAEPDLAAYAVSCLRMADDELRRAARPSPASTAGMAVEHALCGGCPADGVGWGLGWWAAPWRRRARRSWSCSRPTQSRLQHQPTF